ncbi:hypothetical protein JS756_31040 [Streptomyces actuosus]|uniref:Carrier domain-containing protein n=1 Tax=Streptomyces actuosus TaxID=1885 RepID=A0ABS2VZ91_STRAS|nr:phosphopantetheine-binding protein [Streptomyces actuosus]MBN0048462.1 hypothetical protein [Streptomyces actuosus]
METLPLTPNGKVDRRALAAVAVADAAAPETGVAGSASGEGDPDDALSGTEQALAAIWAEILRLPRVTRDDDFLALGGQSLQASRMVSRIRRRLGVSQASLSAVFDHPTVTEPAARVDAAG